MTFDEDATTEQHERRITRCRSCAAQIIFLPTANGKNMPIDALTVSPEDDNYNPSKHESHFAKCPNAARHRQRVV